jgi:hypothetical protein
LDAIASDLIPTGQHSTIASCPERRLVNFVDGYLPQEIQAAIRNTEPASMLTRLPTTQQLFASAVAIAESPSGLLMNDRIPRRENPRASIAKLMRAEIFFWSRDIVICFRPTIDGQDDSPMSGDWEQKRSA